jgi:hypothetical protein
VAFAAADPGVERGQSTFQRCDFAEAAAGIRIELPEQAGRVVGFDFGVGGADGAHIGEAEGAGELVAIGQGFGEMLACIHEQNRRGFVDIGDEREQHGAFGAERRNRGDAAGEILGDGAAEGGDAVVARTRLFNLIADAGELKI